MRRVRLMFGGGENGVAALTAAAVAAVRLAQIIFYVSLRLFPFSHSIQHPATVWRPSASVSICFNRIGHRLFSEGSAGGMSTPNEAAARLICAVGMKMGPGTGALGGRSLRRKRPLH